MNQQTAPRRNPNVQVRRWLLLSLGYLFGMGGMAIALPPRPALSAEKIYLTASPLQLSLSVKSLETFAETGKPDRELRVYAKFAGEQAMTQFRIGLQQRFKLSHVAVAQLTYSPMGEDLLQRIGQLVQTESGLNGFYAIRASWIMAARNPDGFTILDLLRQFPTKGIQLTAEELVGLVQELSVLFNYRDEAVGVIAKNAQAEAAATPISDFSQLPDPRQPGSFRVTRRKLNLQRPMQTMAGEQIVRKFTVELYLPEGRSQPASVVVVSHGMGSTPAAFGYLGEHLSSHGFAVAIPEHIGSGEEQKEALLKGLVNSNVDPTDFVERPLDVRQTLDELERLSQSDPAMAGRLNLQRVGMMGHSFGGYTALAAAGARLNMARVKRDCAPNQPRRNLSLYLQCLSNTLPVGDRNFVDPRIKAVIAINPLTSVVLGPEGMGEIAVPTLLVGASNDILTTPVQEQIHPFLWLKTPEKYLAMTIPAGHTAADRTGGDQIPAPGSPDILFGGPDPTLAREYIRALSLVFMQTHVGDRPQYRTYLNAAYASSISRPPVRLNLIRSLTPEQLEQAFGGRLPIPIFPPGIAPSAKAP